MNECPSLIHPGRDPGALSIPPLDTSSAGATAWNSSLQSQGLLLADAQSGRLAMATAVWRGYNFTAKIPHIFDYH